MSLYSVVLFIHVVAALALAAAVGIDLLIFAKLHLRTARRAGQLLELWAVVPVAAGVSGLLLLLSGAYLTTEVSAWTAGWPEVAVAMLILLGAFGGITSRRMRALRQFHSVGEARDFESMPLGFALKISLATRIALVLGAVLLMAATPGLRVSLSILVAAIVLGFLSALSLWRRPEQEPISAIRNAKS